MPQASRLPLRVIVLASVIAFAAAAVTYAALSDGDDDGDGAATPATIELEPAAPTGEAPSFTTFDGEVVALSSLAGRPVVVNFFASTCSPCIKEMPAFDAVFREVGDEVAFLGLAVQDRPEAALELVEDTGVTYPTALDPEGSVINALGGTLLPTTALLDAEGRLVATHLGALDAEELRRLLADELDVGA